MNKELIIILTGALLLGACSKKTGIKEEAEKESISVILNVNSAPVNDALSINQDQTFADMAIYVYDDDASTLEKAALIPSFSPTSSRAIDIPTKPGVKSIYLVANYSGKTFKRTNNASLTLSNTTTKQELESMITESSSGFVSNSLLMVGKQTITVLSTDNGKLINIPLRRLQARVDVHVFKGINFGSNVVTLESITLHNQIRNSEVKFDYSLSSSQMLSSPIYSVESVANTSTLSPYVNGIVLQPSDANAIFYSYQNLITSPLQTGITYLEIKIKENGITHTYNGYLTDNNQVANQYSLLQNNIYRIIAILDIDSKIVLNVNVLPWNTTEIGYERPITANDFAFGPWGTSWGGTNGKTMNTNVGGLEDAVFQFELKAPIGAAWTATVTNGLDFGFTSSTAGTSTQTVASGFTNVGSPSLIAVRALKRWTGVVRETEFYITVEGNEIPINPVVGAQRRYEGTDKRIKIKQVASYN